MSMYTVVEEPLVLKTEDDDNLYETYAQQFLQTSRKMKSDNVIPEEGAKSVSSLYAGRASTRAFFNYQKKMQDRLYQLNDNMSNMVRESFSGIDSICNKVREYVQDLELGLHSKPNDIKSEKGSIFELDEDCDKLSSVLSENLSISISDTEVELTEINLKGQLSEIQEEDEKQQKQNDDEEEISVIEELDNADLPHDTECDDDVAQKKLSPLKIMWLNKQQEFFKMFQNSMESIDKFDKIMDKYVNDINVRIDTLKDSSTFKEQKNKTGRLKKPNFKAKQQKLSKQTPTRRYISAENIKALSKNLADKIADFTCMELESERNYLADNEIYLSNKNAIKIVNVVPDVSRKRAFSDLHKRLVYQLEANDSFLCFQRLMKRKRLYMSERERLEERLEAQKRKRLEQNKRKNANTYAKTIEIYHSEKQKPAKSRLEDLAKKYSGSLWFSQKGFKSKKGIDRTSKLSIKSLGSEKSSRKAMTVKSERQTVANKSSRKISGCDASCKLTVHNNSPLRESEKCRIQWMRARIQQTSHKLDFCDILDELTQKDLQPLQSEYPRRDNLTLDNRKQLRQSYLYQLMYGKHSGKNTWQKLFESDSILPKDKGDVAERNSSVSKIRPKRLSKTTVDLSKEPSIYKINNKGDVGEVNRIVPKNRPKKLSTTSVDLSKTSYKKEVYKKLLPHIINPQTGYINRTVTVMPVQVSYTNPPRIDPKKFKKIESPHQLKTKNIKKDKPTHPESPCSHAIKSPKLNTTSAKNSPNSSNTNHHSAAIRSCHKMQSQPPAMAAKSAIVSTGGNLHHPVIKFSPSDSINKTMMAHRAQPRKIERFITDLTTHRSRGAAVDKHVEQIVNLTRRNALPTATCKTCKQITNSERKLWANKYAKSVGQKLVRFVENQPATVEGFTEVSNLHNKLADDELARKSDREEKKVIVSKLPISDECSKDQDIATTPIEHPKEKMLDHLRGLKMRNEKIKGNIQKAIDVIEAKMVDILSCTENDSVKAFNVMEEEITNVLEMMKSTNSSQPELTTIEENPKEVITEGTQPSSESSLDFNSISEELYKKLQHLVDTSSTTSISSEKLAAKISDNPNNENNEKQNTDEEKQNTDEEKQDEDIAKQPKEDVSCIKVPEPPIDVFESEETKSASTDYSKSAPLDIDRIFQRQFELTPPSYTQKIYKKLSNSDGTQMQNVVVFKATEENEKNVEKEEETYFEESTTMGEVVKIAQNEELKSAITKEETITIVENSISTQTSENAVPKERILNPLALDSKLILSPKDSQMINIMQETKETITDVEIKTQGVGTSESTEDAIISEDDWSNTSSSLEIEIGNLNGSSSSDNAELDTTDMEQSGDWSTNVCYEDCSSNEMLKHCSVREIKFIENMMEIIDEMDDPKIEAVLEASFESEHRSRNVCDLFEEIESIYEELSEDQDQLSDHLLINSPETHSNDNVPVKEEQAVVQEHQLSFSNIVNFLDALNDIVQDPPIEVYTAREVCFVHVWHQPMTFEYAKLYNLVDYLSSEEIHEETTVVETATETTRSCSYNRHRRLKSDSSFYNKIKIDTKDYQHLKRVNFLDLVQEIPFKNLSDPAKWNQICQTLKPENVASIEIQVNNLPQALTEEPASTTEESKSLPLDTTSLDTVPRKFYDGSGQERLQPTQSNLNLYFQILLSNTVVFVKEILKGSRFLKLLKKIEKFVEYEILAKKRKSVKIIEVSCRQDHVIILQMFYAMFFLLIFAATALHYKCL